MCTNPSFGRPRFGTGTPKHSHVRCGRANDHLIDVDTIRLLDGIANGSRDRIRRQRLLAPSGQGHRNLRIGDIMTQFGGDYAWGDTLVASLMMIPASARCA